MRHDVAFDADGVTPRGWLFVPEGIRTPAPGLVMTHGFSGIREQDVHAERFVREGFVVLFYDHRNFGASDGLPRQEVDPWRQVIDTRHAISFMRTRPEVDPERIGLWGTSFFRWSRARCGSNGPAHTSGRGPSFQYRRL